MYPTIKVLLNKSIMIKVYHHVKTFYYPSIIVKEYQYTIVSLLKSFSHTSIIVGYQSIRVSFCNNHLL